MAAAQTFIYQLLKAFLEWHGAGGVKQCYEAYRVPTQSLELRERGANVNRAEVEDVVIGWSRGVVSRVEDGYGEALGVKNLRELQHGVHVAL